MEETPGRIIRITYGRNTDLPQDVIRAALRETEGERLSFATRAASLLRALGEAGYEVRDTRHVPGTIAGRDCTCHGDIRM